MRDVAGAASREVGEIKDKSVSPQELFAASARILIRQYAPDTRQPPSGWLRTNINTASTAAYNAAQYQRTSTPAMKELYPYWQFKTREDSRVRPEHEMLDNRIYSCTDPIWDSIYPPLGWNCRCYVTPLTQQEMQKSGITPEPIIRPPSETQKILESIPMEFRKNPALDFSGFDKYIKDSLKQMSPDVRNEMKGFIKQNSNLLSATSSEEIKPTGDIILNTISAYEEYFKGSKYPIKNIEPLITTGDNIIISQAEPSSFYDPDRHKLVYSSNTHKSPLAKQIDEAHEASHYMHESKNIITPYSVDSLILKHYNEAANKFNELSDSNKNIYLKKNYVMALSEMLNKYDDKYSEFEIKFMLINASDFISALTHGQYGKGHFINYWKSSNGNAPFNEFFAHIYTLQFTPKIIFSDFTNNIFEDIINNTISEIKNKFKI